MINNEVFEIVFEQLNVGLPKLKMSEITEDTSFKSLGADSLDMVELVMALEEKYDRTISDDVADTIKTVGDAIRILSE